MNIDDKFGLHGEVKVIVFEGELPAEIVADPAQMAAFIENTSGETFRNLVTNVGRQQMTQLIVAETTSAAGYIAVSTGTIVPALTDTTLPSEIRRNAVTLRSAHNNIYQRYSTYFAPTEFSSTAIAACGLFDTATTGGNLFADAVISMSKTNTQGAVLAWTILAST